MAAVRPPPSPRILVPWLALAAAAACGRPAPPPAAAVDPRLIEVAAEPTQALVLAGERAELAVRVRVSAGRLPAADRPPLNLVLVLDTSGSMAGEPIAAARAAARELVTRLSPRDRIAVIAFHSRAEVIVPSVPVTSLARAWAGARIDAIEARGTTDLAGGLAAGLAQLARGRAPGSLDRIVLLGDGVPNDASSLPALIAQAREARASVTTLGFGLEFDEAVLGALALDTGGAYHYVAEPGAVARVFDDELARMERVVARNVVIELAPGPGVALEPMPGLVARGGGVTAWLGDLAAGEVRDVIVPLAAVGRRAGAPVELVDVAVTYDDAAGGTGWQRRDAFVAVTAADDAAAVTASVTTSLEAARRRAVAASEILEAIAQARGGDVAGGVARLTRAEEAARAAAAQLDDAELAALADRMRALQQSLARIAVAALDATRAPEVAESPGPAHGPRGRLGDARGAAARAPSPAAAPAPAEPAPAVARYRNVAADAEDEQVIRAAHVEANQQLRH